MTGKKNSITELAKKVANPISSLISLPFQDNLDFNIGSDNALRNTMNIQPVIPIYLGHNVNLILRTILPVVYAESPSRGVGNVFGLGDTLQSFFFGPADPVSGWIIGAGPVINWPTSTDSRIMPAQFGGGPTIVLLRQDIGFTYGILAFHMFSFCINGDDQALRNLTFLQPFINYTFKSATGITINTETSYSWYDKTWTVPINLIISQVFKIGKQPMQIQLGGRYYAVTPEYGPEWGLRMALVFMFPR